MYYNYRACSLQIFPHFKRRLVANDPGDIIFQCAKSQARLHPSVFQIFSKHLGLSNLRLIGRPWINLKEHDVCCMQMLIPLSEACEEDVGTITSCLTLTWAKPEQFALHESWVPKSDECVCSFLEIRKPAFTTPWLLRLWETFSQLHKHFVLNSSFSSRNRQS